MMNPKTFLSLLLLMAVCGCKKETDVAVPLSSEATVSNNFSLAPESGDLLWYRHRGFLDGTSNWANKGMGIQVSDSFGIFKSVFATDSGVIYGIQNDGKLMWYRHRGFLDGTSKWAKKGTGIQVGEGFSVFKSVFATSNGVIYGIQNDGKLIWYRHLGFLDGTSSWANNGTGIQVGTSFDIFKSVFATDKGVVYGIRDDGKLLWYRHNGFLDGTSKWANKGTGIQVGVGWGIYKSVFATDKGVMYGIQNDGKLIWYRHLGFLDGTFNWANNGTGIQVGVGWGIYKSVFATDKGVMYGINP